MSDAVRSFNLPLCNHFPGLTRRWDLCNESRRVVQPVGCCRCGTSGVASAAIRFALGVLDLWYPWIVPHAFSVVVVVVVLVVLVDDDDDDDDADGGGMIV